MDYAPSRQDVETNFSYHQGDTAFPPVQWDSQNNRDFRNATINPAGGDVNVYANNVIIEQPRAVYYAAPVVEAPAQVQRVGYQQACYPNDCYGRNRGDEVAAQFFGSLLGGVIGGAIARGGRHHHYDRGHYDRGYYDRGHYDRGYYDRGNYGRQWYPPAPHHNPFPQCPPYYGGGRRGRCR